MAAKTKSRRERGFWEELLEPEDGHLTPLAAAVGAMFGVLAFVVGRYVDSTLEDREALLARHRWEMQHRQPRSQLTQDQVRDDERSDDDERGDDERGVDEGSADEGSADEGSADEHVPTYDQCESWVNRDHLRDPRDDDHAAAAEVVDGEVVVADQTHPGVARSEVAPVSTTEVEKNADSAGDRAHPVRRRADELPETAMERGDAIVEVEHPDAATAVAAAATAVAQANHLAPEQPVVVVVAEDVPDWVDEDPGF
ncbi:hypothetical protein [Pseudonocardia zijingensis]|uniref:Uncharacterized protein n=1 Tax=Pseudonocardia zijingensis TaxID=153376 RepID=A0ABN1N8N7_9PSEU